MEKINLNTYTEQRLKKKTHELRKFIQLDIYIRIEQIINKALEQHFILKSQIDEILALLQECEQQSEDEKVYELKKATTQTKGKTICVDNSRIIFHNQMHDFEVENYKKILILMLTAKADTEEKNKINGITL